MSNECPIYVQLYFKTKKTIADFTIISRIRKNRKGEVIIPNNGLVSVYISIAHNGITRFYNTGLKTAFSTMKKTNYSCF